LGSAWLPWPARVYFGSPHKLHSTPRRRCGGTLWYFTCSNTLREPRKSSKTLGRMQILGSNFRYWLGKDYWLCCEAGVYTSSRGCSRGFRALERADYGIGGSRRVQGPVRIKSW
jgi:hypothetical protein